MHIDDIAFPSNALYSMRNRNLLGGDWCVRMETRKIAQIRSIAFY